MQFPVRSRAQAQAGVRQEGYLRRLHRFNRKYVQPTDDDLKSQPNLYLALEDYRKAIMDLLAQEPSVLEANAKTIRNWCRQLQNWQHDRCGNIYQDDDPSKERQANLTNRS